MDFGTLTNVIQWIIWGAGSIAVVVGFVKKPHPKLTWLERPSVLRLIIVLGIASSGLHAYLSYRPSFQRIPEDKLDLIEGKSFANESVEIDGKRFDHCKFFNVRFEVKGKSNSTFSNDEFLGTIAFHSDSSAVATYNDVLIGFGIISSQNGRVQWSSNENATDFVIIYQFPAGKMPIPDSTNPLTH
jgi:hypothetical protein